jgi:hypothetical protein
MKALAVGVLTACLISAPAFACVEPELATPLPDGATASRDAMLSAQKAIRAYDAAVKEYAACLETTGGSRVKGNNAVDKLSKIADQFNAELRAFKKRSGT